MRNFLTITAVFMFSFFMVSCGEEDPSISQNDTLYETDDGTGDIEEVIDNEAGDEVLVDNEEADEIVVPDEAADNNVEVPDETAFQKIGDFNLMFNGKVNVDLSQYMNIKGGTGDVNFTYNGTQMTFTKLTVIIVQLFPLAVLQQGNVAVMWLDSAPGLGAETKQVFGYTFPSTIAAGDQTMEGAKAFAFYGDININLQGGQFDIKCVRAAAYAGPLNMMSYTGTDANFNSSGDLLDPAAAGSQLPYPVCED